MSRVFCETWGFFCHSRVCKVWVRCRPHFSQETREMGHPADANYGKTVKVVGLDAEPPRVVTATFPVLAPVGTVVAMVLSLVTVNAAFTPPNVTLLACVRPLPVMVTGVPTVPLLTLRLLIVGRTLKL